MRARVGLCPRPVLPRPDTGAESRQESANGASGKRRAGNSSKQRGGRGEQGQVRDRGVEQTGEHMGWRVRGLAKNAPKNSLELFGLDPSITREMQFGVERVAAVGFEYACPHILITHGHGYFGRPRFFKFPETFFVVALLAGGGTTSGSD